MSVNPSQTDPSIQSIHGNHLALVDTGIRPVNKLVLMIVGTDASAKDNLPFDSFAASLGYHVLSLDYKNTVITTACSNSDDSACFNAFRQEIVFGEPVSELVQVDSANSIYHRVYELLLYLSTRYPQQHWQQFITGKYIAWDKIIVAGHSQGAGHAAFVAKKFPVYRVLIFAGPQDYLVHFNSPASWLSEKGVTSPSRYFAFLHFRDPFNFNRQLAGCLRLMEVTKPDSASVGPSAFLKGRHILVTNTESGNPHGSMLQPVFKEAWAYLLSNNPSGKF